MPATPRRRPSRESPRSVRPIRLLTFAPAHPAAALLQARAAAGVHPRCHVYAPLGADLLAHLGRLAGFNARPDDPTAWAADVRAGADWLARGLREQPGTAAVVAARPGATAGLMLACVEAGLPVLAAGPWAVRPADLPVLDRVDRAAELRDLPVCELAPLRFDPGLLLLREVAADPDVFGAFRTGTPDAPAVALDLTRHPHDEPAWAFDGRATDGLAAVGPLADLALRLLAGGRPPAPADLDGVDGTGWPGMVDRHQFAAATGLPDFPPGLAGQVAGGTLTCPANGTAAFTLGGVAVRLSAVAEFGGPPAGDAVEAVLRGERATLTARSGAGAAEVAVDPAGPAEPLFAALVRRCQELQGRFPGLSVVDAGGRFRLAVPGPLPTEEERAAAALAEFAGLVRAGRPAPAWERGAARTRHALVAGAVAAARRKQGAAVPDDSDSPSGQP